MRWIPDWLIYALAFGVLLTVLFRLDTRDGAPPPYQPDQETVQGDVLPPPSVFDPEVLVEVGPAAPGLGTAFAINPEGWWLTARHVVDGCGAVGVQVARGQALPAQQVLPARFADLAFIKTEPVPGALQLNLDAENLSLGQQAYHIGYPQGRAGEATSRLVGRERLIARGRYSLEEPVLAWAEAGRTEGLNGSLAGMSGGPTLAEDGSVIGVTIAESPRRGRIYTAAPSSIERWLEIARVEAVGARTTPILPTNYSRRGDQLRRELVVRPVICQSETP